MTNKVYTFGQFLRIVRNHSFWVGLRNLDYWEIYHSQYFIDEIMAGRTPIHIRDAIKLPNSDEYELMQKFKKYEGK